MKVLLDTCVLSELQKANCNKKVIQFISDISNEDIFISVISIGEISKGITGLEEGKKKKNLKSWLASLEKNYVDRILTVDTDVARIWGELTANAQKSGITVPAIDGLLAATAINHGLKFITRNTTHVQNTGAMIESPW
jgi:predicted nucleic acid-binding protein